MTVIISRTYWKQLKIVGFIPTWTKKNCSDWDIVMWWYLFRRTLMIDRYTVIRKDWNTSVWQGGGVLVAFKKKRFLIKY